MKKQSPKSSAALAPAAPAITPSSAAVIATTPPPKLVAPLTLQLPAGICELVSTGTVRTNPDREANSQPRLISWSAFREDAFRLPAYYVCVLPRNTVEAGARSLYNLYEISAQGNKHDVDLFLVGGVGSCEFIAGKTADPTQGTITVAQQNEGVILARCHYVETSAGPDGKCTDYAWVRFAGPLCILLVVPYHGKKRPELASSTTIAVQEGDGSPPPILPGGDYSGDENDTLP